MLLLFGDALTVKKLIQINSRMVLKSDKEKVKTLLAETIRLLCKNGLNFKAEFSVEALVGITLDRDEEFFLSIKETVKSDSRPQKSDHSRTSKDSWRNSNKEIKGEPGQASSCQRKRTSETVTNVGGSSELPSLSLGDMQEGEQSFWSSVTGSDGEAGGGGGGTEGANHASKRAKVEASEDDSNSNVIEIKGEPESGSEEEDGGGGGEASQVDQSGGDMSGTYTYATPVTSAQEMIGSNIAQVWDQLPPFANMPGPSGMATGAGMSQDGQQQMFGAFPHYTDLFWSPKREPSSGSQKPRAQSECGEDVVIRNILLCKGKLSTPRNVTMNIRGRQNTTEILRVMERLDRERVGLLVKQDVPSPVWYLAPSRVKAVFLKKPASEILDSLVKYKINVSQYESRYSMDVKEQENNYNWAMYMLKRSEAAGRVTESV